MSTSIDMARARAEAQFKKKEQQARDGEQASAGERFIEPQGARFVKRDAMCRTRRQGFQGSAGVGQAHAAGTGESGSISYCALRSGPMFAIHPSADVTAGRRHLRRVPQGDSCTATK